MAGRLNNYLADAARRRAFREAMGLSGGDASPAGVTNPQGGVGSQRAGNQAGGMASGGWLPPLQSGGSTLPQEPPADGKGGGIFDTLASGLTGFALGGPLGAGAAILGSFAGGSSGGRQSSRNTAATAPSNPENRDAYLSAQQQALSGGGAIDPSLQQQAMSQGLGQINAQAQRSRETLGTNLASRGLLHSGMMGTGLANVEQGRLQSFGALAQQLAERAFNYRTQAQESAMNREAGMMQQQAGIAQQQRALEAAEPQWWETLAQAAVPISQYLYQRDNPTPSMADVLGQVFAQPGGETPIQTTPTRGYLVPPGFGEHVAGRT